MVEGEVERAIVAQWRAAGPALAAVRRRELRELSEAEALGAVLALLDLAADLPPEVGRFRLGRATAVLRARCPVNPVLDAAAEIEGHCIEPLLELKDAMSNMDRLEEILERDTQ